MIELEAVELDLPALSASFGRRLHEAGVPVTPERAARFADALALVRPVARRRLYWTARAIFVSDRSQAPAFDAVFSAVFAAREDEAGGPEAAVDAPLAPAHPDARDPARDAGAQRLAGAAGGPLLSGGATHQRTGEHESAVAVPVAASDEERLQSKRFDALEPAELVAIQRLMTQMRLAAPRRRTRRAEHHRLGERVDMRRTLRASLHSGGEPFELARRRRRAVPRRIVLLCDVSGSMEPYARAYLHFLTSAIGAGPRAEAFVFATRLTRITRALATRSPEQAIRRAAAAVPDWSSGTRLGEALREFNNRHGRRGMARGAVVVVLSDGWERGDPQLVAREMERLARLAYRIVWVNPRAAARGFAPRAGGMAAALPFIDALVSGDSFEALADVMRAISDPEALPDRVPVVAAEKDDEPWASATPVPGSSVAMPSGYGPSRGRTTPGWSVGA